LVLWEVISLLLLLENTRSRDQSHTVAVYIGLLRYPTFSILFPARPRYHLRRKRREVCSRLLTTGSDSRIHESSLSPLLGSQLGITKSSGGVCAGFASQHLMGFSLVNFLFGGHALLARACCCPRGIQAVEHTQAARTPMLE
jgi:hypothetical protein